MAAIDLRDFVWPEVLQGSRGMPQPGDRLDGGLNIEMHGMEEMDRMVGKAEQCWRVRRRSCLSGMDLLEF